MKETHPPRRLFRSLGAVFAGFLVVGGPSRLEGADSPAFHVDARRLQDSLERAERVRPEPRGRGDADRILRDRPPGARPSLDESKVPIGVVQGIVGLKRWKCVVTGFANHAGTTPMNHRRDALAAASRDVLAVREVVRAETGRQVGTVGYVRAEPGAVNVIPGRAEFSVELRDLDAGKIDRLWERIQERFKQTDVEETSTRAVPS